MTTHVAVRVSLYETATTAVAIPPHVRSALTEDNNEELQNAPANPTLPPLPRFIFLYSATGWKIVAVRESLYETMLQLPSQSRRMSALPEDNIKPLQLLFAIPTHVHPTRRR